MNAIPPKGQMPGQKPGDPVRLTMDFDDEPDAAPQAASTHDWQQAEDSTPEAVAALWGDPEPELDRDEPHGRGGAGQKPRSTAGRSSRSASGLGDDEPSSRQSAAIPAQLAGIELLLTVEVGSLRIPLRDLLAVEPGQLLGLDSMAAEPVSVLVNGKLFARGEIVAIGERFGIRLIDIVAPARGDG